MERRFWILWMIVKFTIVWIPMKSSAETCPAAIMKASPSTVIHHGHTVNLTCTLTRNTNPCNPGSKERMKIYTQKTLVPGKLKTDSVTVQYLLPPPGETIYQCWKCKMLCVISVFAGFPPDRPRSITCEQEGELGKMFCSWETGRETFIETTCTLQLLQKTHNVTVSSKCSSQAHQSLLLPLTIAAGGKYIVLVKTNNELGENVSLPYTFTYIDAETSRSWKSSWPPEPNGEEKGTRTTPIRVNISVKPYPPDNISVTCETSHTCTVTIHTSQDVQHFQLRYRITNESVWEQVEILSNRSLTLHSLHPLSQYEFQAACKYVIAGGKWSNWSDVVTHETPEDAPRGKIEVWYRLHRINRTVAIFWKYLNLLEFRGQIQFYQVIFEDCGRHDIYIQNTTNTWLSRNMDTEGCVITVSAHNSMGISPPTSMRVTTHSLSGFPAPTNVIAISGGPENITLRWELPSAIGLAGDQIVSWEDPTGMDPNHTNWITVPKHNRSVTISGRLKPHICYQFYVYMLWEGRAGLPGITQGSTQQTAPPHTGPKFKYEVYEENSMLVTWQDIPAEARMGCITHYSIYLRAPPQTTRIIKISSNQSTFYQYKIDKIERKVQYSLEMTCSNEAGESSPSPLISAYVQPEVSEDMMMVSVYVAVLLAIGFLFSISLAKQRVQLFLSRILPHWWSKPVPDPANCEWAKEYISNKEKREILSNVASSVSDYDEETETLQIEEMMSEDDESPASVFSYKIDIATIRTAQEENNVTPKDNSEGILPVLTIKLAQGGEYKSVEPGHSPSDYLVHHDMRPSDYLVHHVLKPSDYLVHHDMKPSDYLDHHDLKPSDYLDHHDLKPSDYLVHHDMKPSDYLVHHDIKPSDYLVHHDMKPSNYLVHHDMTPSDYVSHHNTLSDNLVHHVKLDYLAHYEVSDSLAHQDVKFLNPMIHPIKPSDHVGHNEIKVDYLPTNMLTIMEDLNKERIDLFHQQLFLSSKETTGNTISLDTVQINFPYTVQ